MKSLLYPPQKHLSPKTQALGVNVSLLNRDVIGQCDMIVIAVKPYQVLEVMQEMHQMFKSSGSQAPKTLRPLVVSVAASVPLAEIEKKVLIFLLIYLACSRFSQPTDLHPCRYNHIPSF